MKNIILKSPLYNLALGLTTALFITTTFEMSYLMGLVVLLLLFLASVIIVLIRKHVPTKIKIPAYLLIIGLLITAFDVIISNYLPLLSKAFGIYLPLLLLSTLLIVKLIDEDSNKHLIKDNLKLGFSYMIALSILGLIREVVGSGTLTFMNLTTNLTGYRMMYKLYGESTLLPFKFLQTKAGVFIIMGVILALVTYFGKGSENHD